MLEKIIALRKQLHKHPELSGEERQTAAAIRDFIREHYDTHMIEGIGGNGLVAVYDFPEDGPSVMIRCELDALPIEETNNFSHRSQHEKVSHKCGHDGHMAIVAGLIFDIKARNYKKGRLILLFQPAEETGKGAEQVLKDSKFADLDADFIFALHNIPGEPLNSIINIRGHFSSTVQSMAIYLKGRQSHASEPENGLNPAMAMAEITEKFNELNIPEIGDEKFTLLTPVYMNLGSKDYGISAGHGELHFTIRTKTDIIMEKLKERLQSIISEISGKHRLSHKTEWFDYFPAVQNNAECNELIRNVAHKNSYRLIERGTPFRFGEDFGWFSKNSKACMFGLGAGTSSPALHHADYDFPDEIIETGIRMFSDLTDQILG